MHSIVIFASGTGTNAQAIIDHFKQNGKAHVSLIVSNKAEAGVLEIAKREHIPFLIVDRNTFGQAMMLEQLTELKPDLIVLAGFLWKIPASVINAFHGRIINIHPALLPKYGGKGMYGHHVHDAVVKSGDKQSGITIHHVDEVYDNGATITQAYCNILPSDGPDDLASRIHMLEHFYYPRTIEFLLEHL